MSHRLRLTIPEGTLNNFHTKKLFSNLSSRFSKSSLLFCSFSQSSFLSVGLYPLPQSCFLRALFVAFFISALSLLFFDFLKTICVGGHFDSGLTMSVASWSGGGSHGGGLLGKTHFLSLFFPRIFSELNSTEMHLLIVRGINLPVPPGM